MKVQKPIANLEPALLVRSALVAGSITFFLWFTSINAVSPPDLGLAFLMLLIPLHSYALWKKRQKSDLPMFAMLAFMYWIYYALQLFWGDLVIQIANSTVGFEADPAMVTKATLMALIGVMCLWLGMKVGGGRLARLVKAPQLAIEPSRQAYVGIILIMSSTLSFLEPSLLVLGSGGRQAVATFVSIVPIFAFTLLFRRYLRGEATWLDKVLVAGFLVTRSFAGLSSGWLGSFASIIMICGAVFLVERRRIPRVAIVLVVISILFFQVGKEDFRKTYWSEGAQASKIERVSFWINSSLEHWSDAIEDPSRDTLQHLFGKSLSRVSLLTQTANVLDQTPRIVPYQYGHLYSYLYITWIPRAVWPDKPSVSEANQFYQVAYGVTREEDLSNVAIGVGVLTEAFISFGWFGVVMIMFLLGIFFDFYSRFFSESDRGMVLSTLGIVLLPQMLGIESQMAAYVGGLVQQVVFSLLVFVPALKITRSTDRRFSKATTQVLPRLASAPRFSFKPSNE
ncbi:MAG TPA: O-antigen polysaccharide polymerase Wzy [Pyrinomonadaceae bacterium]|jgi:hypothetical protein